MRGMPTQAVVCLAAPKQTSRRSAERTHEEWSRHLQPAPRKFAFPASIAGERLDLLVDPRRPSVPLSTRRKLPLGLRRSHRFVIFIPDHKGMLDCLWPGAVQDPALSSSHTLQDQRALTPMATQGSMQCQQREHGPPSAEPSDLQAELAAATCCQRRKEGKESEGTPISCSRRAAAC